MAQKKKIPANQTEKQPKKDMNQLAKHILDISTGEKPKEEKK